MELRFLLLAMMSATKIVAWSTKKENQMARRWTGNMSGERYLGNTSSKEVHDLDQEDVNENGCQIDEIIEAENDTPFNLLSDAHEAGYDDCDKCLGV